MHLSFKYILILLLLASCELVVDVNVPNPGDKVVANAIQYPDSVWSVDLTLTKYILSPPQQDFLPVNNAEVVIESPDGNVEKLTLTSTGKFRGSGHPQPGRKYKIIVTPNGLDASEGEMTMPDIIPILDLKWDSTNVEVNGNPRFGFRSSTVPFKVTFNDPADVKNFYSMEVYGYYANTLHPPSGEIIQDTVIQPLPVRIQDAAIATENDTRHRFGDETFAGKTYTAPLTVLLSEYDNHHLFQLEVRLVNISEGLFKYEETMELNDQVEGDPFAQPVQIFSNMSNGFGIFGGATYDARTYKLIFYD